MKSDKIPGIYLAIETGKFPPLPGEDEEIVNPGMYGKALCLYLEQELPHRGINVPFFCNEDWGWWLELDHGGFKMALCIYSWPEGESVPTKYLITPSIQHGKKWSWSKFKRIDLSRGVLDVIDCLELLFREDPGVSTVTRYDDFPF